MHHAAVGIEQDLVRVRGEQILALAHVAGDRDDFLAGRAKAIERVAELVQRREAGAVDFVRDQHEAFDARVLRGRIDHAQQIAQLHFLGRLAGEIAERALRRIDRELLDDVAFRIEHERGARFAAPVATRTSPRRTRSARTTKIRLKISRRVKFSAFQMPRSSRTKMPG